MASARMFKDYTLDVDEHADMPSRGPSVQRFNHQQISPKPSISEHRLQGHRGNSIRKYGSSIAELPEVTEGSLRTSSRMSVPSIARGSAHSGSPTNEILEPRSMGSHLRSVKENGLGTTHLMDSGFSLDVDDDDDGTIISTKRYGIGVAHTTDGSVATSPSEADISEPVLDVTQMERSISQHKPIGGIFIDRKQGLAPSVNSISDVSSAKGSSRPSQSHRPPEFFSHSVFQIVLSNPTVSHQLLQFSQSRLCGENMEFLARVARYHTLLAEVSTTIYDMHKDFISNAATAQINLPQHLLTRTNNEMKASLTSTLPALETMFSDAQSDIERLVFTDIYPSFVRHQMSMSAAKALGSDRAKYAGLGDCFVLTDPAKADNPILYASDGFVKVTGYSRNEIIPRNCRFLQGQHTDRSAVRRLKTAIEKGHDSVELLLNHKKNGEPFWNLLYTTPLYDAHGNLAFFLGGQVNCSTAIHSSSDIMRILGQAKVDTTNSAQPQLPQMPPPRTRGLLDRFRTQNKPSLQMPQRAPGMENNLLNRIEDMHIQDQMQQFHRAYSSYLVINYSSFLVAFVSAGLVDLLFAIKAKTAYHAQAVGMDIFKFLGNHSSGSLGSDYKNAVKRSLKMGQPISLDLRLCAKPYMGFERFATHWTPLKDEHGAVAWVVLTLGNEQRA